MKTVYRQRRMAADTEVLQMALVGYVQRANEINRKMQEIRHHVDALISPPSHPHKKHHVSPEGRARIASAQRKRWADAKKLEASARG